MRQLQFFSAKELAVMRDRTKAPSYSPTAEEFRRDHERHRAWGLTQRYARKERDAQRRHRGPARIGLGDLEPERSAQAQTSCASAARLPRAETLSEIERAKPAEADRAPGAQGRESSTRCTPQRRAPAPAGHDQPDESVKL